MAQTVFSSAQWAGDTLTIRGRDIDQIEVVARVEQPTTNHENIDHTRINYGNTGQSLPYLLAATPSLVITSDDGLGVGYS